MFDKATLPRLLSDPANNRIEPFDRSVHDWYRFVLSYPPHLVRDYIQKYYNGGIILDPFCGTGTTIVEAKKLGIDAVGLEAHPFTAFAAQTKLSWDVDAGQLAQRARGIFRKALSRFENCDFAPPLSDAETALLLKDSISSIPLQKILILRDQILRVRDRQFRDKYLLALASIAVKTASNLRFGPEVGVGTIKSDARVFEDWLEKILVMSDDLSGLYEVATRSKNSVIHMDSRSGLRAAKLNDIGLVITSPPYPNEKDYTRTTRLETVLLGYATSKEELRSIKRGLVRSNTRGTYTTDIDDSYLPSNSSVHAIAAEIEAKRVELNKTSGFEKLYGRVTKHYFGGMARHLEEMSHVMKHGGVLAYVVGDQASFFQIMIRTGGLIAEIADSLGYEVIGIELFRTRVATATKQQLNEEVVLLRWKD